MSLPTLPITQGAPSKFKDPQSAPTEKKFGKPCSKVKFSRHFRKKLKDAKIHKMFIKVVVKFQEHVVYLFIETSINVLVNMSPEINIFRVIRFFYFT